MFGKHMLCIVLVAVVFLVTRGESDTGAPSKAYPERPCIDQGGICLQAYDCPKGKLAEKGLCPAQQKSGVECCYGVAKSEKRCRYNGGECKLRCPDNLTFKEAIDCAPNQKCCMLE